MTALLIAVALAIVAAPRRHRARTPGGGSATGPHPGRPGAGLGELVVHLGGVVRTRVPALAPADDPVVGSALLVLVGALAVSPMVTPFVVVGAAAAIAAGRRRAAIEDAAAMRRCLPDTVDLLRLAVGAGATPRLALAAAARHGDGPLAAALVDLDRRLLAGSSLAAELDRVAAELGPAVLPVIGVVRAAALDGAPLAPALDRLADELRADRRRHAEADARRLPVKLLLPLVCCALPALVLLSIVPLVVGTLRSLRL